MQNQIPNNWQKVKLGNITDINMGQSPSSKFYNLTGDGLPFYQGVTDFGEKYPEKAVYCSSPIKIADKGDIYFSVRAPVGDVNIAVEKSCIGRGVSALKMKNGNNSFLYFLLKSYSKYFKGISGGTTYESINKDQIAGIDINVPIDREEQERISSILSAFDDKIEVNNKIAKILEEMAQAIFKEWFISYPREESKMGSLRELMDVDHGFAFPSSKFTKKGEVPVIKIKNILEDNSIDTSDVDYINYSEFNNSLDNFKLKNGDIVLAMTGATSGKIGLLSGLHSEYLQNQRVGKFVFKKNYYKWFCYTFLTRPSYRGMLLGSSDGSAQGNLSPEQVKAIELFIPPDEVLEEFNSMIGSFYSEIIKNKLENQKLAALRDLLLPKLMKGEIRV